MHPSVHHNYFSGHRQHPYSMTALPLLITTATIAYTVFFPDDKRRGDGTPSSNGDLTHSSLWWGNTHHNNNTVVSKSTSPSSFLLGIFVGMSLSWMISYEAKRRRFWESVRLKFLSWLYDGSSSITATGNDADEREHQRLADKFRTPTLLSDLQGTPIPRENSKDAFCGTHLDFLSPDWTLSSGLYVDVLTLPSGSELLPSKANGVEFYFVIKGSGKYSRNGETFAISPGYGFISDPGTMRGFLVVGMSSLILLRATDTPFYAQQSTARMQRSSLSSAISLVSAGLNKIQQMVEESNGATLLRVSQSTSSGAPNDIDQ